MGRIKAFSRNSVLIEATNLFWTAGYTKTSLSDLEKATGVNKSGLYSEFNDKDDLFLACLKNYAENNGAYSILSRVPQGLQNLKDFLLLANTTSGPKGCFITNTLREFPILPKKTRSHIQNHMTKVSDLVVQNIEAQSGPKMAHEKANLIMTFSAGLSLRLNLGEIKEMNDLVESFLSQILIKKN